jgi:hypothetical protein
MLFNVCQVSKSLCTKRIHNSHIRASKRDALQMSGTEAGILQIQTESNTTGAALAVLNY